MKTCSEIALFIVKIFSALETKMVLKIPNETFLRITRYFQSETAASFGTINQKLVVYINMTILIGDSQLQNKHNSTSLRATRMIKTPSSKILGARWFLCGHSSFIWTQLSWKRYFDAATWSLFTDSYRHLSTDQLTRSASEANLFHVCKNFVCL